MFMPSWRIGSPARFALVPLVSLVALVFVTATGCKSTDEEYDPYSYAPGKEAYQQVAEQYASQMVREAGAGAEVVGHGARTTDVRTAGTMAFEDAVGRMLLNYLIGQLRTVEPGAGEYFQRQPAEAAAQLARKLVVDADGPYYRWLAVTAEGNEYRMYDLYQRYTLPAARERELIEELVALFKRTAPAVPQNIEFSVVLADMPADLSYEEKIDRVVRAVEQQIREVGARGTVQLLERSEEYSPEDVALRKRQLISGLPNGTAIEVSLDFEFTRRNKLESIAFADVRGRWQDPVRITEHPTPRGGRYEYRIGVPSLLIHKGQPHVRVQVVEEGGRRSEIDYELTPARFEYSDENIGLLEIQDFDGRIGNLLDRLREVRLPDQEGNRTVMLRLPSRMRVDGQGSLADEGLGVTLQYKVSLFRPGTTTVYALRADESPSRANFRTLDSIQGMDWQVVWRQHDPDRIFGDLSDIQIQGADDTGVLYVRIDYNNDRDTDVLRFNVQGYTVGDVVRDRDAEIIFSTTRSN